MNSERVNALNMGTDETDGTKSNKTPEKIARKMKAMPFANYKHSSIDS